MAKFGASVIGYTIIAIILHCLFIAFTFLQRPHTDCVGDRKEPISNDFELFIVWTILYFPFLIFCAFYTLLFRMCRSFLCSCWQCCGNNVHGKGATKCKICFEGVFGNPLIFAIIYIIWGIFEWISFGSNCVFEIQYGFLGDLVIVSISLLLLCIYYFVRIKRKFEKKRNENIAKKYQDQQREDEQVAGYNEGGGGGGGNVVNVELGDHVNNNNKNHHISPEMGPNYQIQAPPNMRLNRQRLQREGSGQPIPHKADRRYSAQPIRQNKNGLAPAYAASAQGVAPYQAEPRRHSYNPQQQNNNQLQNNVVPAYAASAQGIAPYRPEQGAGGGNRRHSYQPDPNPLIDNVNINIIPSASHKAGQESASIEISVDLGDEDDIIDTGHRTRGPSISFPSKFKGHARRVSSGILNILQKIDAEPECAVCMCELEKGDEMGQLECGHTFHKECIVEWLGNEATCPMCRDSMTRK